MKKTILVCSILFSLIFASAALAQEESDKESESKSYEFRTHEFEAGYEMYYFRYEEPTIDVTLSGVLYGLKLGYTYRPRNFMLRGTANIAGFGTDYDGGYQSGEDLQASSDDYIMEYRGLVGYSIPFFKATKITPYVGFGLRYWWNEVQDSGGYSREVSYYYTPIGFEYIHRLNKIWSLGIRGEYDIIWYGQVRSNLSDVAPQLNDVTNKQENPGRNFGTRASIFLRWEPKKFILQIEPYFRYWSVEQSNLADLTYSGALIGFAYEPENTTGEYGVRVSMVF